MQSGPDIAIRSVEEIRSAARFVLSETRIPAGAYLRIAEIGDPSALPNTESWCFRDENDALMWAALRSRELRKEGAETLEAPSGMSRLAADPRITLTPRRFSQGKAVLEW